MTKYYYKGIFGNENYEKAGKKWSEGKVTFYSFNQEWAIRGRFLDIGTHMAGTGLFDEVTYIHIEKIQFLKIWPNFRVYRAKMSTRPYFDHNNGAKQPGLHIPAL